MQKNLHKICTLNTCNHAQSFTVDHAHNPAYLVPRVSFNLRKFEFRVIRVHLSYLFLGGRAQYLYYLNELVDPAVPREDRLP